MMTRRSLLLGASTAMASSAVHAQTPSPRLRIGQIGTEHAHASGKMDAIRRLSDLYEVVGLASKAKVKDDVYAGLTHLDEAALLAAPGLQAVVVETSLEDSCATAMKAIRAGKHIHLDKPGALDHEEFKTMRMEAATRGLVVQMGYMLRYNPAFVLAFQAAKEGWLGEITEIDGMMGKLGDARTRSTIGALPGGGMFELGCHMIDAVVTLLGKPAKVLPFSTPTQPGDGVKDNQLAVLEFAKATVTLRSNHADPFGGPRRRFQVTGTKGSIEIMPMESGELVARFTEAHAPYKKGEQKLKLEVPKGRYDQEFVDLAKVIRGEKQLAWSAEHDIAVHETVLRAAGVLT